MPCDPWPTYESAVYGRFEESLYEYMDDEMLDELVPALKKFLETELAYRREQVVKLEAVMAQLFPEKGED